MDKKLPKGWKEVELGDKDYFEVKKGSSITKKKLGSGKIPVIAGGQKPAYYHNESNRKGETVTISASGAYAGFINYFNIPIFASDCSTIQAMYKKISLKYIFYYLKSIQKKIYDLQRGIAQPHVYPKDIVKLKIPLPFKNEKPDLKKQKQIVSILEKAEQLKQKREHANKLADEYLKAVFNEMFLKEKFEIVELKEICDTSSGGTPSRSKREYWENGNIPWIKSGDLNKDEVTCVDEFITKEGLENSSAKYIKPETVLIAMYGATAGKCSISRIKATTNQAVCAIVPKNKDLDKTYLLYYLRSKYKNIVSLSFGGGQPNISQNIVRSLKIPLPPLPLQKKFASIVKDIEKIKEKQKKSKKATDELFNALMQKAFKGEIV